MTYLNCPLCGLSVARESDDPAPTTPEPCPRCQGQFGAEIPMYATDRPRPPFALARTSTPRTPA